MSKMLGKGTGKQKRKANLRLARRRKAFDDMPSNIDQRGRTRPGSQNRNKG